MCEWLLAVSARKRLPRTSIIVLVRIVDIRILLHVMKENHSASGGKALAENIRGLSLPPDF